MFCTRRFDARAPLVEIGRVAALHRTGRIEVFARPLVVLLNLRGQSRHAGIEKHAGLIDGIATVRHRLFQKELRRDWGRDLLFGL